jgi:protein-tyrosine phosphatase
MTSPFIVLSVCMGNICRSPMAERMLIHAMRERIGDRVDDWVCSESAGTGGWHAGEAMNPPAAGELRRRGAASDGFRARKLLASHVDTADLVLTATAEQVEFVAGLRPDAASRVFVLGEFGRLVAGIDADALPALRGGPEAVHERALALVSAVDAARGGARSRPADDLDDPWGRGAAVFRGTADAIHASIQPFVDQLFPVDQAEFRSIRSSTDCER